MEKKKVRLAVRNKEQSKQRLLDAVGKLLQSKGFAALKVNDIAATAGLDKKLIYNYFGSTDQLIDAYIRSLDFWSNAAPVDAGAHSSDGGKGLMKQLLTSQFDAVAENKELQKILLWGISEKRKSLKRVADEREARGEQILSNIIDVHFGAGATRLRAIMALVVAGIYYTNMYAGVNASTFCGIDITKPEGKEELKKAIETIVDLVYQKGALE